MTFTLPDGTTTTDLAEHTLAWPEIAGPVETAGRTGLPAIMVCVVVLWEEPEAARESTNCAALDALDGAR